MSDRDLLEAAAMAAGVAGEWCEFHGMEVGQDAYGIGNPLQHRWGDKLWNPLTDDGDALRLAVKLGLHIQPSETDAWVTHLAVTAIEPLGADPYAATRRAIVRAAAALTQPEGGA